MKRQRILLASLLLLGRPSFALNKQSARSSSGDSGLHVFEATGSIFSGAFIFNPSYAARPDNTGLALFRFGLHVDLDFFQRLLTLSYDENTFTDGSSDGQGWYLPSEHDHIVGLLSTIQLPHDLSLTLAAHYEHDLPGFGPNSAYRARHPQCGSLRMPGCFDASYSQSYVDAYARLSFERGPLALFVALGGFLYNPSYAARPDNAGLALLRYVAHGEFRLLPRIVYRLDANFFTDRDEFPLTPTEVDLTSELGIQLARNLELRLLGEADLPLGHYPSSGPHPTGTPGLRQVYLAGLLQWSFNLRRSGQP